MTPTKEHRPRLKGDHPYRTTTKFQRNPDGKLLRDDEGYLVPIIPEREKSNKRASTPDEREAGRMRSQEKAAAQLKTLIRQARRIRKRQNIGDPDCVQSRDEDFPLLAVLRRDKAYGMIASVLAYRQLVALCEAEPLKGQSYGDGSANGVNVEYRSILRDGVTEVDAAYTSGFKGRRVPGGEIAYRGEVKRQQGAYDIPAKRILPAEVSDDGTPIGGRTESLHIKINEDTIADYIDSRPRLEKIRVALGPLLEPVEDAVLGGQTLQAIGEREGFTGPQARSVGNALVMRGLTVLDGFLGARKHTPANDNYLIERRKVA